MKLLNGYVCLPLILFFSVNPVIAQKVFRIRVGFPTQVRDSTIDLQGEIQLLIDYANEAFNNSSVNARMELSKFSLISGADTSCFTQDPSYMDSNVDYADAHMYSPKEWICKDTNNYSSDIMDILVHYIPNQACGFAHVPGQGSVVESDCHAFGWDYAFVHEVAHNFGADHDRQYGWGGSAISPYGYGHYNAPLSADPYRQWKTIMAYDCISDTNNAVDKIYRAHDSSLGAPWWPCPASHATVPYFSNPNVAYHGDYTGISDSEDVARLLNNQIDAVRNFKSIPNYLHLIDTLSQNEIGNPIANDTMIVENTVVRSTGIFNIRSGQFVQLKNFTLQNGGAVSVVVGAPNGLPLEKKGMIRQNEWHSVLSSPSSGPNIVRIVNSFYLEGLGKDVPVHVTSFDLKGNRLFSQKIIGNGQIQFSKIMDTRLLLFRLETGGKVFWIKKMF